MLLQWKIRHAVMHLPFRLQDVLLRLIIRVGTDGTDYVEVAHYFAPPSITLIVGVDADDADGGGDQRRMMASPKTSAIPRLALRIAEVFS